ncbi:Uncharacterised protein [Yersinia enterocolitica]|nr:Uncharacterised protein [Yersinia enterocolitica]
MRIPALNQTPPINYQAANLITRRGRELKAFIFKHHDTLAEPGKPPNGSEEGFG